MIQYQYKVCGNITKSAWLRDDVHILSKKTEHFKEQSHYITFKWSKKKFSYQIKLYKLKKEKET